MENMQDWLGSLQNPLDAAGVQNPLDAIREAGNSAVTAVSDAGNTAMSSVQEAGNTALTAAQDAGQTVTEETQGDIDTANIEDGQGQDAQTAQPEVQKMNSNAFAAGAAGTLGGAAGAFGGAMAAGGMGQNKHMIEELLQLAKEDKEHMLALRHGQADILNCVKGGNESNNMHEKLIEKMLEKLKASETRHAQHIEEMLAKQGQDLALQITKLNLLLQSKMATLHAMPRNGENGDGAARKSRSSMSIGGAGRASLSVQSVALQSIGPSMNLEGPPAPPTAPPPVTGLPLSLEMGTPGGDVGPSPRSDPPGPSPRDSTLTTPRSVTDVPVQERWKHMGADEINERLNKMEDAMKREKGGRKGMVNEMPVKYGKDRLSADAQMDLLAKHVQVMVDTEDVSSGRAFARVCKKKIKEKWGFDIDEWQEERKKKRLQNQRKEKKELEPDDSEATGEKKPPSQAKKCNRCALKFLQSSAFQGFCTMIIIGNTMWIGAKTDSKMRAATGQGDLLDPDNDVGRCFLIWFCFELGLKIAILRKKFYTGADRGWNYFDAFVVSTSLFEEVFKSMNVSFMRTMRLFRIARILRIMRLLRFFTGLRLMLITVLRCGMTLFWACLTIGFLVFIFGICVLQFAVTILNDNDPRLTPEMKDHYGSLPSAMYTLLLAISNGASWKPLAEELHAIHPLLQFFFVFFILFAVFGILNVVAGVFVHQTGRTTQQDRDLAIQDAMLSSQAFVRELKGLLDVEADNHDSKLDWESFQRHVARNDVQMYFQTHNIDVLEAEELYDWLDPLHDGHVTIDRFVYGCEMIKGGAKAMALVHLAEGLSHIENVVVDALDKSESNTRFLQIKQDEIGKQLLQLMEWCDPAHKKAEEEAEEMGQ